MAWSFWQLIGMMGPFLKGICCLKVFRMHWSLIYSRGEERIMISAPCKIKRQKLIKLWYRKRVCWFLGDKLCDHRRGTDLDTACMAVG